MKRLTLLLSTLLSVSALGAGKPAPKPKPGTAKPSPAHQPSVHDLAVKEAKKYDLDHNGRIEGTEVSALKVAYAKNPGGWLYLFDDNGNKMLDDAEVAAIRLGPPAPPKPDPKTAKTNPKTPSKTPTKKK